MRTWLKSTRGGNAVTLEKRGKWTILNKTVRYQNPWMSIIEHEVIRPDNEPGIYGVVEVGSNSGIVAMNEKLEIILLDEYIFPFATTSLQIPSGQVLGEDPLIGAKRELKEETGIIAENWISLGTFYLSGGISTQIGNLFLATGLTFEKSALEGTEDLIVTTIPLAKAVNLCVNSQIKDSVSIVGIFRAAEYLRQNGMWS